MQDPLWDLSLARLLSLALVMAQDPEDPLILSCGRQGYVLGMLVLLSSLSQEETNASPEGSTGLKFAPTSQIKCSLSKTSCGHCALKACRAGNGGSSDRQSHSPLAAELPGESLVSLQGSPSQESGKLRLKKSTEVAVDSCQPSATFATPV